MPPSVLQRTDVTPVPAALAAAAPYNPYSLFSPGGQEMDIRTMLSNQASWNQPGAGRVSTGPFGMLRNWYQNAAPAAAPNAGGPPNQPRPAPYMPPPGAQMPAPNAGGPPNQPRPAPYMPPPGAQMPATDLSGVLNNNFSGTAPAVTAVANNFANNLGAPAIKPAAQPAAAEKMGYEAAKAKYGRNRAVEMQQAGEVGD